jgi:glycosyltransferase involved in cell wall biosynthesis
MAVDLRVAGDALIAEAKTAGRARTPRVSVIVPTYRHERWLGETARAILDQDLPDEVQLIVCNDASPDGTGVVMESVLGEVESTNYPGPRSLTYLRLSRNRGPATGRNAGLDHATGAFIAFTDSDCTPSPAWLRKALDAFSQGVGIVQGRTCASETRVPLFEHHIDIGSLDGTFATANVVYRRDALSSGRFDPRFWSPSWTMEDAELAWRVLEAGWSARYAEEAVVLHRVIPLSARAWLAWPIRFRVFPMLVSRHPGFKRHLLLGVWMKPLHLWFDLALAGALLAFWWPPALVLLIPYVVAFARTRGIRGRFPPATIAAHVAWDAVSFLTLATFSLRYRVPVL